MSLCSLTLHISSARTRQVTEKGLRKCDLQSFTTKCPFLSGSCRSVKVAAVAASYCLPFNVRKSDQMIYYHSKGGRNREIERYAERETEQDLRKNRDQKPRHWARGQSPVLFAPFLFSRALSYSFFIFLAKCIAFLPFPRYLLSLPISFKLYAYLSEPDLRFFISYHSKPTSSPSHPSLLPLLENSFTTTRK